LTNEPVDTDSRTEPYFLDTNILMYAIGRDHPYKAPCIRILELIEDEAISVVSNVEVLQEILHRYRSLREYEIASSAFLHFKALCDEILPVGEVDMDLAFRILEGAPEISVRDAVHAATMLNCGLEKILSADAHFDRIDGIVRIDPRILSGEADQEGLVDEEAGSQDRQSEAEAVQAGEQQESEPAEQVQAEGAQESVLEEPEHEGT